MKKSCNRRGFSVLEVLIVSALVATMLMVFVLYQSSGQQQSLALDFQAAALQATQILVARLQEDFDSFVPGALTFTYAEPNPQLGVTFRGLADLEGHLGLPVDPDFNLLTDELVYNFDPRVHLVYRNGRPIRAGPFENVTFTFFPARPDDPTPPHGDTLVVDMFVVPPEAIGRVNSVTPQARFRVEFHSPQGTSRHIYEDWVVMP